MEGQSKRRHRDVDHFEEQAQEMEGGWCAPRGQNGGILVEKWSKAQKHCVKEHMYAVLKSI